MGASDDFHSNNIPLRGSKDGEAMTSFAHFLTLSLFGIIPNSLLTSIVGDNVAFRNLDK